MNSAVENDPGAELKRLVIDFARRAATEITTFDEEVIPGLVARLLPGTTVYVAHTPRATLQEVVRTAVRVQAAGLNAAPHIVARRIGSSRDLRDAANELSDAGVSRALVIGGDGDKRAGSYASAMDVLNTGILTRAGVGRIGVAGHPEGHPTVGQAALWHALTEKQEFAESTGTRLHVVTQFGFDPAAICKWIGHFAEHGITLPVYVGMAGPTPLPKLIRYAMQCGVGASLRGLMRSVTAMRNVTQLATSPDEMMTGILTGCGSSPRIVGPHFFSLGGAMATATWLRAVADGYFDLKPEGGRFDLRA
jgi:methylenetetrahydrofolate reductase (NADPH)